METIVEIYDALKDYFIRERKMTEDQFNDKVILNNDVLIIDFKLLIQKCERFSVITIFNVN